MADVERFAAFRNVGKQNVYEWVLPVARGTALIFERCNAFNRRQVPLAEIVILGSEEAFPTS